VDLFLTLQQYLSMYGSWANACSVLKVWPAKWACENEFKFAADYRTRSEYSDILSILQSSTAMRHVTGA
jgi:hypothetical protein